jgi:hypothetical protein
VAVHHRKNIAAHLRANGWNALEQGHTRMTAIGTFSQFPFASHFYHSSVACKQMTALLR